MAYIAASAPDGEQSEIVLNSGISSIFSKTFGAVVHTTDKPVTVDILAVAQTAASGLYGFSDVLSSVGVTWESTVSQTEIKPLFNVRILAASRKPFTCVSGAIVVPDASTADVDPGQIVLVPAVRAPVSERWTVDEPSIYEWLASIDRTQTRIASACTGALVLAEAGILDGHEATTHWAYRYVFQQYYPRVRLCLEKNLCASGDDDELITCGGASAWQSLALDLISRYCGHERAIQAARLWLMPATGALQSPYSAALIKRQHEDPVIRRCENWIGKHFDIGNPVDAMTELSELAPTTFSRRFKRATNYSPIEYVQAVRIEAAKSMLESKNTSIDKIGRKVGYEDTASFRRLFKRRVGVSPTNYRRRFGGARFED
jgi:transcriptional regulator GlxA family with amidase domain